MKTTDNILCETVGDNLQEENTKNAQEYICNNIIWISTKLM